MIYSVEQIKTKEDCDRLIALATMRNRILSVDKQQELLKYDNVVEDSGEVETAIDTLNAEIASRELVFQSMPEGPAKVNAGIAIYKLGYRKILLQERKERSGVIALLEKEYVRNNIDRELEDNQAYINAVSARKDLL